MQIVVVIDYSRPRPSRRIDGREIRVEFVSSLIKVTRPRKIAAIRHVRDIRPRRLRYRIRVEKSAAGRRQRTRSIRSQIETRCGAGTRRIRIVSVSTADEISRRVRTDAVAAVIQIRDQRIQRNRVVGAHVIRIHI